MRYFYLFFCTFLACSLFSQTPPYINYQGVARNSAGDPFVNKTIGLKFDIRQGSATGTVVFSESQSVSTGNFGVFSVRIGTTTAQGVGGVNWNAGNFFLQVSIDTTDSQNYTVLGVQQIISVPYALQAASVPASFTNNVLSVGTKTMAINDQSLSLSAPNTLSITNGNTVEIAPSLAFTNNILTVGPPNNTVTIPMPAQSTFTGTGAAVVTSTGSTFQVNVPKASITPSTNMNVSGTFPDFTVSATPTLSLLSPNTLSISGGNTVQLAPTIALNGNSLSVGSPTNFITVPTPTLTGTGAASINPPVGLNYIINVPATNLTQAGGGITIANGGVNQFTLTVSATTLNNGTNVNVSGAYPNFTINATPTLNFLSANTLSISGGNSVTIAPSLTFTNNVLTVGPSNNTVNVPASNPTITSSGVASVSPSSGTNFNVHVPNPVLSTVGQSIAITQGTANNSVLVPSPTLGVNNNTLSVGSNSIALESYTVSGPGLTMSPGPNHTIASTPVNPTITSSGVASVSPSSGTNFNVHVPNPVLSTAGQSIAITQGTANNSVLVPSPTLGVNNNTLSVGTNSIALESYTVNGPGLTMSPGPNHTITSTPVNPTITSSGVASVSPSSGTNFNVHVPNPVLSTVGQSIAISQGTANSSVLVPSPTIGINSNTLSVGTNSVALETYTVTGPGISMSPGPNHTITTSLVSPTFAAVGAVSVTPSSGSNITVTVPETAVTATTGIATVSSAGTNSFNVNVPAPSLSVTGNVITVTQGTATSSSTIPSPNLTITGTNNNSLTAGANTIALNTYTVSGPDLQMNGPGPNYTIVSTHVNPTVTGTGAASISPASGSLINVHVPLTAITVTSGIATISPAGTNSFNIAVPSPSYNPATGALNTGTASTNITPTLQIVGNVLTVGPAGNTVPLPASSSTIQQSGIAQVSPSTGNNFTVHVPPPVYNPATGVLTQGTATQNIVQTLTLNTNTLSVGPTSNSVVIPNANITGTNAAMVTSSGNSHTINVPFTTITGTNNVTVSGISPNWIIDVPTPTITGAGMAVITPSNVGNNFVVNVSPTFTPSTGVLGSGTYTVDVSPAVTFTNNVVTVGRTSNSVNISSVSPWTQNGGVVALTNSISNVGIGTSAPAENLQVESSAAHASISIISSSPHLSSLLFGTPLTHGLGRIVYDNSANTMDIFQNSTSRMHIDANGNLGLKTTASSPYDLNIFNPGTSTAIRLFNSSTASFGLVMGLTNVGVNFLNYDNTPMHFGTNSVNRMSITAGGNVGIGTTVPTELLQVESASSSAQLSIVSPSPQTSQINFGYQGNHLLGSIQYNSTTNILGFGTNGTTGRMVLDASGRVGIGNTAPQENLQVETTSGNAQISIVSPSPQVSVLNFGNTASHNQGKISYQNTGDNMIFSTSSTDRMVVSGIGRVGIGNMAPQENLQVETTGNTAMSIISSTASTLFFGTSANHVLGAVRYDNSNNSMNFWTNNTANRMVITNAGNVGIGTATPGINAGSAKYLSISSSAGYSNSPAAVEIEGSWMGTATPFSKIDFNSWGPAATTSTNVARIGGYNGGTVGMGVLGFSTRNGTTMIERMRIDEAGKVTIGSFAQTATLQVIDGNQAAGKVLTSDATGNATWMDVLPAGMVMAYAGSVIPTGWLICDGAFVQKSVYPNLWTAIGGSWGGATATHFYVPDMRGMFLRGVNGGAVSPNNDPDAITRTFTKAGGSVGNNVGSLQQDMLETHNHTSSTINVLLSGLGAPALDGPGGGSSVTATGGQETRPKNVYVYYIIKY